jgi:BASS family bile acid:Na+ symporter
LLAGLAANLVIPIGFIFVVTQGMRFWHNPDEVQNILLGLALVASMPIAGSSTAWAQNANGNLALSLGLALSSTLLSPLTTPFSLHSVGLMAKGEYSQELHSLAGYGAGVFLVICVLAPSLLGILLHRAVGQRRIASVKSEVKLFNYVNLLLLSYSNASVSLPQTITNPDWDFMAVTLAIVVSLCLLAFASGWFFARLLRTDLPERTALMFGLGMNNNGTGMVLASMTMSAYPRVMLPIIFYNLVQHLVAGGLDFVLYRKAMGREAEPA